MNMAERKAARARTLVFAVLCGCLGAEAARADDAPQLPTAYAWTPEQMNYLINSDEKKPPLGAEVHAQYFYHYFKRDRDPHLQPPPWVDQLLEAMLKHPVWQDPEEGILNEAQLWQAPASVLYEFFEHTRKTFPPEYGGYSTPPENLIKDYEDSRTRFQMAVDRIYRARLGDSLQGRGRAELATFDLILREMNSVLDALTAHHPKAYVDAVMAVGALTNEAYDTLSQNPRGVVPSAPEAAAQESAAPVALKLLGILVIFAAFWSFGTINSDKIAQVTDDYISRSRQWVHEFNRQFIQIKVQYLAAGPIVLFMVLGMLTFNLTMFLILTGGGVYLGYNLPRWALAMVKSRRGKQCEAQLMDAMILMSNALKSGLDIVQGFELVSRDLTPPISEEFGLVIKNYQLGTTFEKSLEGMMDRVSSRLLGHVTKAIIIQRGVGGNLTKIFDRIVENIREESKLEEKVQSLTAQQRIQALVVGFMPWLMMGGMFVLQPGPMIKFYGNPLLGIPTILFCAFWMSIGMGIVRKLADIRV